MTLECPGLPMLRRGRAGDCCPRRMKQTSLNLGPTLFVVVPDTASRMSLRELTRGLGLRVEEYRTADEFLAVFDPTRPGCLILNLPAISQVEVDVLGRLAAISPRPPVIILAEQANVSLCARAFRAGAFDFIEQPADGQLLVDSIQRGNDSHPELKNWCSRGGRNRRYIWHVAVTAADHARAAICLAA
jgi:FixJ family two-component response regulator